MHSRRIITFIAAAALLLGLASVAPAGAAAKGRYIGYSAYKKDPGRYHDKNKVVLFFHAPWCPHCRETDKSLRKDGVPAGLIVVQVDYDSEKKLRKKYGVTVQHTFVQVSANGKQIGKWTGSRTGKDIKRKTR